MRRIPAKLGSRLADRFVAGAAGGLTALAALLLTTLPLAAAEGGGSEGLPQLTQTHTFVGQIFWTIVTFGVLYAVMTKVIIPRVGEAMEERQDKIDDDVSRAEKLKRETEQVIEEYEAKLAEARGEARETVRQATEAWEAEAAKREKAAAEALAKKTGEAESRIAAAKQEALANLKSVATEVSAAATAKLLGASPSEGDAQKAVEASLKDGQRDGGRG
jgi:F-type H+-transporting ATPase subunit b